MRMAEIRQWNKTTYFSLCEDKQIQFKQLLFDFCDGRR